MKPQTIWQLIVAALAIVVLVLAAMLHTARSQLKRTQTALQMTEAALAELKDSVQKAVAVGDQQADKADQRADQQARVEAVIGIYTCDANTLGKNKMDLRSDGSAFWFFDNGQPAGKTRWTFDGSAVNVGASKFTTEQSDLIDSRGNRWIHVR